MIYKILYKFIILISIIFVPIYCSVIVTPLSARVVYVNKEYLNGYTFFIKRYSRKSAYYINAEASLKTQWNNNVTFHLVFYEYLHNEYRRSFVELHYKYCDLLNNEKFIAPTIRSFGIKCPLAAGNYSFINMTFPMEEFPNVFPFEKARADIEYAATSTGETLLKLYFDAAFRNKIYN